MSFMKEINKMDSKTDPWGRPTFSASGLDLASSKYVIEKRLDKKLLIKLKESEEKPYRVSFNNKSSWSMVSKALERSKKIAITYFLSSRATTHLSSIE